MPSLVGDHGQVFRVLGWALTRIYRWYYTSVEKKAEECVWNRAVSCLAIEMGLVMLASTRERAPPVDTHLRTHCR